MREYCDRPRYDVALRVWHIAYPDLYTGLLFARREDGSILKFKPHLSNVRSYLYYFRIAIYVPRLISKEKPSSPLLMHRLTVGDRFKNAPTASCNVVQTVSY